MDERWYKHYAADFLEGTSEFSNQEVGIYMRLLDHQFCRDGFLPKSVQRIANLVTGTRRDSTALTYVLNAKFERDEHGRYFNRRMLATILEIHELRKIRVDAGRQGGLAKAKANAMPSAKQELKQKSASALARDARLPSLSTSSSKGVKEESEKPSGKRARQVVDDWNEWAKANDRPAARLTDTLRAKLATRHAEGFDWPAIQTELERLDDFALGRTDRWNGVTLQWLLANDTNYTKLAAGNYRRRGGPQELVDFSAYDASTIDSEET